MTGAALQMKRMGLPADTAARWSAARRLLDRYESKHRSWLTRRRCATGLADLDDALEGGVPLGAVCEIASAAAGLGALSLALKVASAAGGERRCIVVVDPEGNFYPPAAAWLGLNLDQLVMVRNTSAAAALWAMEQALQCGSVAAVVGLLRATDERATRRLQLAAERGGGVGLLVHGPGDHSAAKFAAVRMLVDGMDAREQAGAEPGSRSRPARVQLLKTWAGGQPGPIVVELGDAADDVRPLAVPGHRL
ncbi:MAG: hypothetical protein GY778_02450, partial [bacterium]|nr:hypothetical protein [bacterium]